MKKPSIADKYNTRMAEIKAEKVCWDDDELTLILCERWVIVVVDCAPGKGKFYRIAPPEAIFNELMEGKPDDTYY